jgi:hypothetical protein
MKTSFSLLVVVGLAALPLIPAAQGRSMDAVVVAEQTDHGALLAPPAADRPAFYIAYDGGYIEAGDPIAGEKPPTAAVIGQTLRQTLAAQGYQPAPAPGAASLLLVYHWGTINKDTIAIPRFTKIKPNLKARIYLVASTRKAATLENFLLSRKSAPIANAWAPVPGFLTADIEDVLNRAQDDLYFVIVSAYDLAAIGRREPTLLWRVKLSARSVAGDMNTVLPALIRTGGPFFGRNLPDARTLRTEPAPDATGAAAGSEAAMPAAVAGSLDAAFVSHLVKQEHDLFSGEDVSDPALEVPQAGAPGAGAGTAQPALPSTLARQITGYRQEKLALQEALAARIMAQTPGTESRAALEAFNRENAARIASLAQTRETIRDQLSQLAAAAPNPAAAGSLNTLLKEYADDVQQWEPAAESASR